MINLGEAFCHIYCFYKENFEKLNNFQLLSFYMLISFSVSLYIATLFVQYWYVLLENCYFLKGIPPECEENKSVWQSLRLWFIWHFSWKDNPCEEYYTALLVDPLWEVTPFMVQY